VIAILLLLLLGQPPASDSMPAFDPFVFGMTGRKASLPIRPDATLTPGAVVRVTVGQVCTPGYSKRARNVSAATKRAVFERYGLEKVGRFEVDHLISLELGGSNAIENLWPESFETQPWNAAKKDALENRLHWLICNRDLPMAEAQRAIATDWIAAYQKFVVQNAVR
jgi:hypothetical protein